MLHLVLLQRYHTSNAGLDIREIRQHAVEDRLDTVGRCDILVNVHGGEIRLEVHEEDALVL